jgi:ubiquitin carboxyl-terminal hydrolase 48
MCRHEVQAVPILDPVSGQQVLLVLQTDITGRAELEARMAALTESQLQLLECLFPR